MTQRRSPVATRPGASAAVVLVLLSLVPGAPLFGQQGPPLISGSFDFLPFSRIDDPVPGTFEEEFEVRVNNPSFELNFPMALGGGLRIVNGLEYSLLRFHLVEGFPAPAGTPESLHDLSYRLVVSIPVADDWRLNLRAQPGLSSDFNDVEANHFRIQGGALVSTTFGEDGVVGFGAVVQNNFGEPIPLPALSLRWTAGRAAVDAQLPRALSLLFRAGSFLEAGVDGTVRGGFYRIGREGARGDRVRYSVISLGPALRARIRPRAYLKLTGGAALARRFEIQDENADALRTIDLEPSTFLRATLEIRPL